MAHARKLIRHAAVASLTNATSASDRVQGTRVEPSRASQLPAIGVYTLTEETDAEDSSTAPRELWRSLTLMVEGRVLDTSAVPVDDAMDDLAEQIEAVMDADRYLGGTAGDSILISTDMAVLAENASDPIVGVVTLTYQVTYRTSPALGVAVADLKTVYATIQIDGAAANNTVADQIAVPFT